MSNEGVSICSKRSVIVFVGEPGSAKWGHHFETKAPSHIGIMFQQSVDLFAETSKICLCRPHHELLPHQENVHTITIQWVSKVFPWDRLRKWKTQYVHTACEMVLEMLGKSADACHLKLWFWVGCIMWHVTFTFDNPLWIYQDTRSREERQLDTLIHNNWLHRNATQEIMIWSYLLVGKDFTSNKIQVTLATAHPTAARSHL